MENTSRILWIGPRPDTDGVAHFAHEDTLEAGHLLCDVERTEAGA